MTEAQKQTGNDLAQTGVEVEEWKGDVLHPDEPFTPVDVDLSSKFHGIVSDDSLNDWNPDLETQSLSGDCEGFETVQECFD